MCQEHRADVGHLVSGLDEPVNRAGATVDQQWGVRRRVDHDPGLVPVAGRERAPRSEQRHVHVTHARRGRQKLPVAVRTIAAARDRDIRLMRRLEFCPPNE